VQHHRREAGDRRQLHHPTGGAEPGVAILHHRPGGADGGGGARSPRAARPSRALASVVPGSILKGETMRISILAIAAAALLAACNSTGGADNGCTATDFVDKTGAGTNRTVGF